eukprot:COSAG06_NODE_5111_length_3712_cov_3.101024_1_plen_658_part_00
MAGGGWLRPANGTVPPEPEPQPADTTTPTLRRRISAPAPPSSDSDSGAEEQELIDGSKPHRLSPEPGSILSEGSPRWSPRLSADRKRGRGQVYRNLVDRDTDHLLARLSSDINPASFETGTRGSNDTALERSASSTSAADDEDMEPSVCARLISATRNLMTVSNLVVVCLGAPIVLMFLLYGGCEKSEQSAQWGEQQLRDVKTYLQEIRLDHEHVRKLKTDMDYLRRSMQQEEMACLERAATISRSCSQHETALSATCPAVPNCTGQEYSNLFTFQVHEVKRASAHVERLKERLLKIPSVSPTDDVAFAPAVLPRTVLTCDWNDEEQIVFVDHPDADDLSDRERLQLRGCHVKIGSISNLARSTGRKGAPHHIVDETEQVDRFGCFTANREPQGCHMYVKRKVDRLRFKAGCASGIGEWGWCGRTPLSFLLPESIRVTDYDVNGCTTLDDAWAWIYDFFWSWGVYVSFAIYTVRQGLSSCSWAWGKLKDMEEILNSTQEDVLYVKAVESGRAGDTHRVSLSLNLVGEPDPHHSPRGSGEKEYKAKLRLRTLRETDLRQIVTNPVTRGIFTETARHTKRNTPFLQDRHTKHGEMRNQMVNLFSNHLSSINASNFFLEDLGEQDVISTNYIFGITYEVADDKSAKDDHVKKVRVLIIRA